MQNLVKSRQQVQLQTGRPRLSPSVEDTHSQYTSAVQFVHKRGMHTQRAWLKNCIVICVRLQESSHLVCSMPHPWLTLSPRALHLPHSLPLRHKNMQHNRYNKRNSENTQYIPHISKLPQSTSCAIKNHSGVKTCRAAQTRAPQLPHVMSPRSLRLSQGSKLILEIHINCMMHRKKLEKKITELLSPNKWRNLERLGRLAFRILKCQRRPNFQSQITSTIPWEALQILISKMESYKSC